MKDEDTLNEKLVYLIKEQIGSQSDVNYSRAIGTKLVKNGMRSVPFSIQIKILKAMVIYD